MLGQRRSRGLWDAIRQFGYANVYGGAAGIARLLGLRLEVRDTDVMEPAHRLVAVV
jgi:hypothetical protein